MPLTLDTKLGKPKRRGLAPSGGAAAAFTPSSVAGYARDWNFADVTKLFQDMAHATPVTANNDLIGAVEDLAGSGEYMAAVADNTTRFTYKTNVQNGLSMGRSDGVNDVLLAANAADTSITLFVVLKKVTAVAASSETAFSFNHDQAQIYTNSAAPSAAGFNYYATTAEGEAVIGGTATNCTIVCLRYASSADLKLYANGGAPTSIDPHDNWQASPFLVLGRDGTSGFGDYDFGRVLIYSAALSDTDLNTVFSGLGSLWSIAVTPVS
jgi:hypothetical protein